MHMDLKYDFMNMKLVASNTSRYYKTHVCLCMQQNDFSAIHEELFFFQQTQVLKQPFYQKT